MDFRFLSSLMFDADASGFAGFRLADWRRFERVRPTRSYGVDALRAETLDGVLVGNGAFAGGATFSSHQGSGTLRIPALPLEVTAGFRGDLRGIVSAPLFAARRRNVLEVARVADGIVIRFECPILDRHRADDRSD